MHDTPILPPRKKAGALEDRKMLHEAGQRHVGVERELADRCRAAGESLQDPAPRRVRQRGEHHVQILRAVRDRLIVNHMV